MQKTAKPKELGMHRADVFRNRIEALEAALESKQPQGVPEGFVLVPQNPTLKMNEVGMRWLSGIQHMRAGDKRSALDEAFKAMLAAAPSPERQG